MMEQQKRLSTKKNKNTPVALDWKNHQSRMTGVFLIMFIPVLFGQLIEQEQLMCSFLRV